MLRNKRALSFVLALVPVAAVGAYFAARMLFETEAMPEDSGMDRGTIMLVSVVQTVLYALICGYFGSILAERCGLARPFRLNRIALIRTALAGLGCGLLVASDAWTFARAIPEVAAGYASAGRFDPVVWIASILYGGVIEEVMIRLFIMSLIALIIWKLCFKGAKEMPARAAVVANVFAALLFAAGHLPATAASFGRITPMILARCFLLNGAAGLVFGRLYRKYGIQYAMAAHALAHVVSRTLWLILLP